MIFKIIKFFSFVLLLFPLTIYPDENDTEIGYGESVPWADFTNFELELVAKLIGYFKHESSFQKFECYYESIKQDVINIMVDSYYDHLETLRSSTKKFNLYRVEIWKLEKALKLDINHVVDMTCALIENDGSINHKINKAFNHWSRDTLRISYPLLKLNPDANQEKTMKFLEKRLFELYYYIQAYVAYKNLPTDKNANTLNMHIEEIEALTNLKI
ncbi:MAG: hypothetical protein Q8K60_07145 [Parachlamydiaceae bacterium]|nr:hypothetical protein [Parachlamydiaceae bacterium]